MDKDKSNIPDDEYELIEVTHPGDIPGSDRPLEAESRERPEGEESFDTKVTRIFTSYDELNEALAYLMGSPDKRENISDKPKYLNQYQIDFLNEVILSQVRNNSLFEILATKAALEKAILMIFEGIDEEDPE